MTCFPKCVSVSQRIWDTCQMEGEVTNTWARNILILLILIDVMTKENKGFQSRLDDYCTDSEDDSKEVTLMGLLDHPLNDTDFPLASNVPISLTFIKANENRLIDHDKTTKIAGKRYQITLTSFELHMLQQTICPQLYNAYMTKLLHSPANFFFNRFETTHHSLPNVSYLDEKIRECSKTH